MAKHITRRRVKGKGFTGDSSQAGTTSRRRTRKRARFLSRSSGRSKRRSPSFEDEFSTVSLGAKSGKRPPIWAKKSTKRAKRTVLGLLSICAGLFLFYLLVFILPSPVASVYPADGSVLSRNRVDLEVNFKDEVDINDISLYFDGKNVLPKSGFHGNVLRCGCDVKDGEHTARLEILRRGWPNKRNITWKFTIDTEPPPLEAELVENTKGKDNKEETAGDYLVQGKTKPGTEVTVEGKSVEVDEKGEFEAACEIKNGSSIEVFAQDRAGNRNDKWLVTEKAPEVKGVHLSIWKASNEESFREFLELVEETELNSLVVDIKNVEGVVLHDSNVSLAQEIGSGRGLVNLEVLVDRMRSRGIYAICRQVVFRDDLLADKKPALAVQDKYGGTWGGGWVDPYSREAWDYNVRIAEEAARAGFQEIQFDYVRFPSDGDVSRCKFPNKDKRKQEEVITGFLEYARNRLAKYNVFVSADLFGLTASEQGEMGIGQSIKSLAEHIDFICPMVYPSHFASGEYGIKNPEANPHDTVYECIKEFKESLEGSKAKIRPWLQDFSLDVHYTSDMVRRQINAVNENDINEWLLWNPNCTYTESALDSAGE